MLDRLMRSKKTFVQGYTSFFIPIYKVAFYHNHDKERLYVKCWDKVVWVEEGDNG